MILQLFFPFNHIPFFSSRLTAILVTFVCISNLNAMGPYPFTLQESMENPSIAELRQKVTEAQRLWDARKNSEAAAKAAEVARLEKKKIDTFKKIGSTVVNAGLEALSEHAYSHAPAEFKLQLETARAVTHAQEKGVWDYIKTRLLEEVRSRQTRFLTHHFEKWTLGLSRTLLAAPQQMSRSRAILDNSVGITITIGSLLLAQHLTYRSHKLARDFYNYAEDSTLPFMKSVWHKTKASLGFAQELPRQTLFVRFENLNIN